MGMTEQDAPIEAAAIGWLVRVNDPEFQDWEAWRAWMADNPRHGEVYWALAETEADMIDRLRRAGGSSETAPVQGATRTPRRAGRRDGGRVEKSRRRRGAGLAVAAGLAAALGLGWFWSAPREIETGRGERQSLTLADGTIVHLDGGSRIRLSRLAPRSVELEEGRALFQVVHREHDPFVVRAGTATVTDLGTVFDVTRLSGAVRVGVAEGLVDVEQAGRVERLKAGEGLVAGNREMIRRSVDVEQISGWTNARLAYDRERLSVVAEDLSRALGLVVQVDPSISERTFSGSLATSGDSERVRERLEALLDLSITSSADGWRLQPRPST